RREAAHVHIERSRREARNHFLKLRSVGQVMAIGALRAGMLALPGLGFLCLHCDPQHHDAQNEQNLRHGSDAPERKPYIIAGNGKRYRQERKTRNAFLKCISGTLYGSGIVVSHSWRPIRRMANIRIGTSGWHYKHWIGNFYPAKFPASKMLAYYDKRFDSVEINNSFYMLPKIETLSAWRDATPPNFEFAIKASRFLTHNKKLKEPENALNNFLPRAEALGWKLGPILFQLPPKWGINLDRLSEFLQALPKYHRYTFEFREPSWLQDSTYELLKRHNAAFCIYELAGFHSPIEI